MIHARRRPSQPSRIRPRLFAFLLLSFLLCPAYAIPGASHPALDPHHVEPQSLFGPIDLTGNLLVHPGDDPSFASPTLDDSQWLVVSTDKPLASYGITHPDVVWYRTHVHLPPGQHHLGLLLETFRGSARFFVNGTPVGTGSSFPPGGLLILYAQRSPIPDDLISSGDVTIALRASVRRATSPGMLSSSMLLFGNQDQLADKWLLFRFQNWTSNLTNLIFLVLLLVISIALAISLQGNREYLALVVYLASQATMSCVTLSESIGGLDPTVLNTFLWRLGQACTVFSLLEFSRIVLGIRRTRAMVIYAWLLSAFFLFLIIFDEVALLSPDATPVYLRTTILIVFLISSLPMFLLLPPLALWIGLRKRNSDALLFFLPLFCQSAYTYYNVALFFLARFHLSTGVEPSVPIPGVRVGWSEVADLFFNVALLIFLILRTVRIARTRARDAAELEAAHTTQQLLLDRASQPTPGFEVHTVYLPAREVGGDFFLVSPAPNGGLTAIVGDVSGKGLTAALRVSLILGVLRRESSRTPSTILANLNQALLTQSEMGFTTACCALVSPSGQFSVANAGHISPYITDSVTGRELPTTPALPLGLAPDQIYETTHGQLLPSERLVMLSDGVPEARTPKGELYGFDRLSTLLRLPAQEIADVAQRFGQEDDITVLTLACRA